MEYLMTYGWAILIIAVVLGALFQLGVFNSSSFSPRAPPGACQVFRPSGPLTTTNINQMGVCTGQLPQYVAQFNGASSYVNAPYKIIPDNALQYTASAWFYWSGGGGGTDGRRFIMETNGPATPWVISIWVGSGSSPHLQTACSDLGCITGSTVIQPNRWYQMALAYTRNSVGGARLYLNGVLDGTGDTQASSFVVTTLNIGTYRSADERWFGGRLANIQIYNASLSANEIQALYMEGIGGAPIKPQSIVGWWPLNGNANDYSGNNNNGVPTAVTFTSQYGK